jgi:hypothetical protein
VFIQSFSYAYIRMYTRDMSSLAHIVHIHVYMCVPSMCIYAIPCAHSRMLNECHLAAALCFSRMQRFCYDSPTHDADPGADPENPPRVLDVHCKLWQPVDSEHQGVTATTGKGNDSSTGQLEWAGILAGKILCVNSQLMITVLHKAGATVSPGTPVLAPKTHEKRVGE